MQELYEGVRRVTFRLPLGITHVHCYLLRSSSGGWTLIDSSLGAEDPEATWGPILAALDAPVERVVITHFHPDHAGGTRDVEALTGAPVLQGREDHAQCVRAWGPERSPERLADYMVEHGMPREEVREYVRESSWLGARVRYAESPQLVDEGDEIDGWRVLVLRGHADGHIVLLRDGVLVAGDTILAEISPAVGLYPLARPDPLGDYLASLRRIVELAPRLALPGHGPPIEDPASRARDILDHHADRLAQTEAALGPRPRRAYEISHELWSDLSPSQRRFALAEALAHLERLVVEGRAERAGENAYVAARAAG